MKKIISLILALVLVLGLAVSASAEEHTFTASGEYTFEHNADTDNEPPYTAIGDVTVTITPPTVDPVYKVDVVWGDLDFEYSFGTAPSWDPESHTYSGGTNVGWQGATSGTVEVTNHSNAALKVSHTLTNSSLYNVDVNTVWDKQTLKSADVTGILNTPNAADSCTLTVSIIDPATTVPTSMDNFTIGKLSVVISLAD